MSFSDATTSVVVAEKSLFVNVVVKTVASLVTSRTVPRTVVPSFETTRTPIAVNIPSPSRTSCPRITNFKVWAEIVWADIGAD